MGCRVKPGNDEQNLFSAAAHSSSRPAQRGGETASQCGGRGLSLRPRCSTIIIVRAPPPPCFVWSPPPRGGGGQEKRSRGASAPEFCSPPRRRKFRPPAKNKGGGAPKGASNQCPRSAIRCCHLKALAARKRPDVGGHSPSGAPTAALAKATEHSSSAQAALRARSGRRRYPHHSIALKRSTPRPGRSAGGDDARTARGRGYKPRPQEPHSLHRSAVAATSLRLSEIRWRRVTQSRTSVNEIATPPAHVMLRRERQCAAKDGLVSGMYADNLSRAAERAAGGQRFRIW